MYSSGSLETVSTYIPRPTIDSRAALQDTILPIFNTASISSRLVTDALITEEQDNELKSRIDATIELASFIKLNELKTEVKGNVVAYSHEDRTKVTGLIEKFLIEPSVSNYRNLFSSEVAFAFFTEVFESSIHCDRYRMRVNALGFHEYSYPIACSKFLELHSEFSYMNEYWSMIDRALNHSSNLARDKALELLELHFEAGKNTESYWNLLKEAIKLLIVLII